MPVRVNLNPRLKSGKCGWKRYKVAITLMGDHMKNIAKDGFLIPHLEFRCPDCKFISLFVKDLLVDVTSVFCHQCKCKMDIKRGY